MIIPFCQNDGGRRNYQCPNYWSDCAVRAISIALDMDYRDVWNNLDEMMESGDHPNNGVPITITKRYLEEQGWGYKSTDGLTLNGLLTICGSLEIPTIFRVPIGLRTYHLSIIKDGEIHDVVEWWKDVLIDPKTIRVTDLFLHPEL